MSSQFRNRKFVHALGRRAMVGSMGRVGTAGDNAAMESISSLLQKNVLQRQRWDTREQLRIAIVTWIQRTYHRRRRHVGLERLDLHRIRSNHDRIGQPGSVTETVTCSCSRPASRRGLLVNSDASLGQLADVSRRSREASKA